VAASFLWLAIFALLFSVGAAVSFWPAVPEGGFHGTDLAAGLAFGAILLVALAAGWGRQAVG